MSIKRAEIPKEIERESPGYKLDGLFRNTSHNEGRQYVALQQSLSVHVEVQQQNM